MARCEALMSSPPLSTSSSPSSRPQAGESGGSLLFTLHRGGDRRGEGAQLISSLCPPFAFTL